MNLRIQFLAIVALVFFSGGVFATEDWEKKLMDQGWVKLNLKELDNLKNTTWYGIKGKSTSNRVLYINPKGKKVFFQYKKGSKTYIIDREVKSEGKVCSRSKDFWGGKEVCRTVWKKDDLRQIVSEIGYVMGEYTIKKGNLENFK